MAEKPDEAESPPDVTAMEFAMKLGLREVRRWTKAMNDPELGNVGESFNTASRATACREEVAPDPRHSANAVYNSHNHADRVFTNSISYGPNALKNLPLLFSARVHEIIHVLQYKSAVSLHTDPFNACTDLILCPRDYVMRKERIEQDAYAKGAWLCSLANAAHPDIREILEFSGLPVTTFEEIRAKSPGIERTMIDAVKAAAGLVAKWVKDGPRISAAENWHKIALEEYAYILDVRVANGEKNTFVRMAEEDIYALGQSFGPNPFGRGGKVHPDFMAPSPLSPENQKLLDALDAKYGIADAQTLPTIREALAGRHQTPQEFMAVARGENAQRPRPQPRP